MRKKMLLLILSVYCIAALTAQQELTFDNYIQTIIAKLPEMKLNAAKVTTAENNLLSAQSIGDVSLGANVGALGRLGNGYPNLQGNGVRAGIGASSLIVPTGTRLNVEISQDALFKTETPHAGMYTPSVTLSVAQPLLYNIFGVLDRYPVKNAQTALNIAKMQRDINDASVRFSYEKMYFDWIMLEKLMANFEVIIREAENFENQISRRLQNGLVDNDAYQNVRRQTLQYRDSYNEYRARLDSVKSVIGYFIDIKDKKPVHAVWENFFTTASGNKLPMVTFDQTIYAKLTAEMQMRARDAITAMKNNTLPQLDLIGTFSFKGMNVGGNYFTSFGNIGNIDYAVGLKFSYPLGNRASKATLREAENSLQSILYECEQIDKDFTVQIQAICSNFELYKTLLKSKQEQSAALESRLATQLKKFEQGRLEADDIITTRLELVGLRTQELNLQYQIITAGFDYVALLALHL